MEIFLLCNQENPTKDCPLLTGLKAIYVEAGTDAKPVCFISQKRPWKPQPLGTMLDPMQSLYPYWNNAQIHQSQVLQAPQVPQNSQPWYPPMPQQPWAPPYSQKTSLETKLEKYRIWESKKIQSQSPQMKNPQFQFASVQPLMQPPPQR